MPVYLNGVEVNMKCECIGCAEKAEHVWGGRAHCADCMPPIYKLGKHKYVDGGGKPREEMVALAKKTAGKKIKFADDEEAIKWFRIYEGFRAL